MLSFAVLIGSPASAATSTIDIAVPSGSLTASAFAIGRQTGVSISFQGGGALGRKVPALRGRMTPLVAIRRLAAAANMEVRVVGPRAFVLSPRRSAAPPVMAVQASRALPPARPIRILPAAPEPPQPDIIVTASKRDILSRRFPGQWARIDGADLALVGAKGTEATEARSVGFSSTHLGAGRNKLFIRGIADSSFSGPTQSPVGQYLGDLRTGYAGPDPDLRLVDMEAVEILEGPQGTLYGAGALGGILLLKPNMPKTRGTAAQASLGLSATQHGKAGGDFSASLNLPLSSAAAVRVTGYRVNEGGYVDNRLTGAQNINDVAVTGGRLIASARVTPDWSVDLLLTKQGIAGEDSQYADNGGDGLSRASPAPLPFSSDFAMTSLILRKDQEGVRIRSTNGFLWQDVDERFDLSDPSASRTLRQRSRARGFSSETRLWRPMRNGFSWLAGLSLLDYRYAVKRGLNDALAARDLGRVENHINEITLYGELSAEVHRTIDVTAGARFTETNLRGQGQHLSPLAITRLAAVDPDRRERRLLPSASMLVRPVDGLSLYLRYQQGFRPGGLSIANDTVQLYHHDLLATAEAGFRVGKPLVDRFDLAGSLSRSRWRHIQADYLDSAGLPVTTNIGDGTVWSASLNGGIRLLPALRLEGGLALNDGRVTGPSAEFTRLIGMSVAAASSTDKMRIPNVARIAGRAAIDFKQAIGAGQVIELNLYGRYVGTSRLGIGPRLGERQGDYFDSGLLARLRSGARALSLAVTNLTDSVGNRFAFGAPVQTGTEQLTPLRPRTLRLGFDWSF